MRAFTEPPIVSLDVRKRRRKKTVSDGRSSQMSLSLVPARCSMRLGALTGITGATGFQPADLVI